jgi:hypothetical protein
MRMALMSLLPLLLASACEEPQSDQEPSCPEPVGTTLSTVTTSLGWSDTWSDTKPPKESYEPEGDGSWEDHTITSMESSAPATVTVTAV